MSALSFQLLTSADQPLRRGLLAVAGKPSIATPNCLLSTVRGAVPHLTPDMLARTGVHALQISLDHFADRKPSALELFPGGIGKFLNVEDYMVVCDLMETAGKEPDMSCSEKYMNLRTLAGHRKVSAKEYAEMARACDPDVCVAPCDPIWAAEAAPTQSRAHKASRRTVKFLDIFLQEMHGKPVLAVLQGSHYVNERVQSATESSKRAVDGYALHLRGLERPASVADDAETPDLLTLLRSSTDHTPATRPRFAYGVSSIVQVLEAVRAGVDMFDSAFVNWATEQGHALHLCIGSEVDGPATYDVIDLWSSDRRREFQPFVSGCECFACARHTRAYCYHLLQTHEMLAHVLLMCHNSYQYSRFFAQLRGHIEAGTFDGAYTAFVAAYENWKATAPKATTSPRPAVPTFGTMVPTAERTAQ
ncbi:tRNA-guanine(15) transglycosylase-like protein [Thamnocephalis sphaerospora]|uniref:Queuine tRNA-ribosyltransferase accessory subunit 2 n=1 Tax=Thamnocephalis sphaerospora TaxID=78915 RepID=A0A4P9XWS9_9FUNG|nr:tRNA-guanine(15) transglycosylase-like protein [Thamnocephalis sphaerospora]|eukprot:RKP10121.1 tRNA-guanine(15) transglycosylase-like protein [Thamnocephalis sphaerospora]